MSEIPHLLNIIIRQRAPVLQLLSGENQTLLVRRDALLVLDLGFDIVDCVGGFDLESDGFSREGFDEAFFGAFVLVAFSCCCCVVRLGRMEGGRGCTSALWVEEEMLVCRLLSGNVIWEDGLTDEGLLGGWWCLGLISVTWIWIVRGAKLRLRQPRLGVSIRA